jgi:hypothetical protein
MKLTILSFDSWGLVQSRKHHLASELSANGYFSDVLYIAPPSNLTNPEFMQKGNLRIFTPYDSDLSGNSPVDKFPLSSKVEEVILSEALNFSNGEESIIWMQSPGYAKIGCNLKSHSNVVLSIYDRTDDYSLLIPDLGPHFKQSQNIMESESDLIYTVSKNSIKKLKHKFPDKKVIYLPNGVSDEFIDKSTTVPKELNELMKPIVGYVGRIAKRLNSNLIEKLLGNFPKVNFAFIGVAYEDISWMLKYPNCFWLGAKEYSDLPDYIDGFDLCIIPHLVNPITNANDPVKLYDYLSRGKRVVTTNVEGVSRFRDLVSIVETDVDFLLSVERELNNPRGLNREAIKQMRENTWKIRAKQIINDIEEIRDD